MGADETAKQILARTVPERSPELLGFEPSTVPHDLADGDSQRSILEALGDARRAGSDWRLVRDERDHVSLWIRTLEFFRPTMSAIPHYQARQKECGEWFFTTPVGETGGFETRHDCLRMAANHERADKYAAATGTAGTAREKALRAHFFPDGLPKPAGFPIDLRPHHGG